jgi:hypothetical protein
VYVCIYRAIKNQPEAELDNASPELRPEAVERRSGTSA